MIVEFLKRTASPHNPKKFWSVGDRTVVDRELGDPWVKTGNAKEVQYRYYEDEPIVKQKTKK